MSAGILIPLKPKTSLKTPAIRLLTLNPMPRKMLCKKHIILNTPLKGCIYKIKNKGLFRSLYGLL